MTFEKISGLIDAPFPPFHPNGEVNLEPIPAYAAMLRKNGLKGVFINGSSGEGYMLTDDERKLGAPKDFEITVRSLKISAGAGFIVALTGEIMTMPGLPRVPAAEKIDVDETGKISGLF